MRSTITIPQQHSNKNKHNGNNNNKGLINHMRGGFRGGSWGVPWSVRNEEALAW